MTQEISALFDGELAAQEIDATVKALHRQQSGRRTWSAYCLLNDVLRREPGLERDLTARIMGAIEVEPVVLAPHRQARRNLWRPVAALAASVAGVAVVGWMALTIQGTRDQAAPAVGPQMARLEQPKSVDRQNMQEYLVAHQSQAAGLQFMGAAHNVRSVAATVRGSAR